MSRTRRSCGFIEKPPATLVSEIIDQGGLWNTFIIATPGQGVLNLFERRYPKIVREMRSIVHVVRLVEDDPVRTRSIANAAASDVLRKIRCDVLVVSPAAVRRVQTGERRTARGGARERDHRAAPHRIERPDRATRALMNAGHEPAPVDRP